MKRIIMAIAALFVVPMLAGCGSVDTGNVGLYNRFGKIDDTIATEGVYALNPFTTKLENMSVQTTPYKADTKVYTRDIQTATVSFNISTSLNPSSAVAMRKTIGLEWRDRILPQTVEAAIKDAFGSYNASDAVAQRERIRDKIELDLKQTLAKRGIRVDDFQLTNIDYSDAFEKAVERAQVATQKANEAKNRTVEVEENAKQTVLKANADAESIRVQAAAISANPAIIELKRAERWNGVMPSTVYCSASTPCVK